MHHGAFIDATNVIQQDFRHGRHGQLVFQPVHGDSVDVLPPHLVVVGREIKVVQGLPETVPEKFSQETGFRRGIPVKLQQFMDNGGTDGLRKLVEMVLNGIIHHSPALQGNDGTAAGGNKITLLVKPGPEPVQYLLPPGIEHMTAYQVVQIALHLRALD